MGKPAARVGDMHLCPQADPVTGVPHTGGVIKGPGCESVLIGGKPAAVTGDDCFCIGGIPDKITGGSTGVLIGGKPAARVGDECAHGGKVTCGFGSVLIGERGGGIDIANREERKELFRGKKAKAINSAIKSAIIYLTKKLDLLEKKEANTIKIFRTWFGKYDEEASKIIAERIQRELDVIKTLSVGNFIDRVKGEMKRNQYAEVYENDNLHRIFVGELFWKTKETGRNSKASVIIHELSHFEDIGGTKDYVYKNLCKRLAETDTKSALFNADNFELFIVS